jgi:eukaryotic-like serine/threonine-protein kinase
MTSMIGTKLAHYEITMHIGSGGMGDVYQAADTKLGRSVAIKFLPEAFSHESERVARFQREARVLASLNHANIAAIHGVEEINGRHFLVMELVPGDTLAERIKHGAIPVEEALPIAKQIAEALEEAHEKGIIHRDLKPANIKVTPEGKVKVLDFGLAKAYEREHTDAAVSNSPTISMAASNAGMILGTAAYMSPEQARGRTLDKRTDLWSLGCVLYEMLVGTPVFRGEDVTEILASVVKSEPDWSAIPVTTPAPIRRLLRRCLEKDRKQRLDSASAARLEIEEAMTAAAVEVAPSSSARRAASSPAAWVIAAAAVLVAAGLASVHYREVPPSVPPEMRTEIVTPGTSDPISFALSPDGKQIVYAASVDGGLRLWLRALDKTTAQPLAATEGAAYPFWSPDSRSIGFFADSKLKRLDIGGGQPQTLANAVGGRGGSWNAEGIILFSSGTAGPLFRISASGGEAAPVTKLDKQTSHRFPQFLPGGREFLFFALGPPEIQGIYLGSLDSADNRRLTAADTAGAYLAPGWLLWMQAGTLRAQRLDVARRERTGDPVTLADPVAFDANLYLGGFSVSAAGLVAYRSGGSSVRRQLVWFDRAGKSLGTLGAPDENSLSYPRIAPDGRRVAVYRTVQGNSDVWLLDSARTTRFTFDAALDRYPVWSPDGSRIVFDSNRKGARNLYIKTSGGAGDETLLVESVQDKNSNDWSRDGRFILFHSIDPQSNRDLWVAPLEGDRKPWVFLKTNFDEREAQFSPDGRWVAYESNESGRYEINVRPFALPGGSTAGNGGQWQVSTAGGICAVWAPDGKELYYIAPDGKLMAVPVAVNGANFAPGAPVALFQTRIFGGGVDTSQGRQYDVSSDGRILINTIPEAASSPITLLQNWRSPAN